MWRMARESSLTGDEQLVLLLHPHWKTLIRPILVAMLVVAIALVNLRVAARTAASAAEPASRYVPRLWVRVLSTWRYQEVRELTVQDFTLALGRLGGHLNRKRDGLPGWITLWRGWERLHTMLEYELSRATCVEH